MLASRLHWRLLIATIVVLMAAAFVVPRFMPAPALDENRVLADKPPLPKTLAEALEYRKKADAYIADRFPPRAHLIGALNRVRMLFGISGHKRVIVGRDGWLFYDADDHMTATRNVMPDAEARAWLGVLAGRTEALKARGIPYVVLAAPMQEAIYPEKMKSWYRLEPNRRAVRVSKLAAAAQVGDVIYAYDAIAAAKARGVKMYSRHDTHWEGPAAYEGYVLLMRRLKALGVTQEDPRPISDFVEARPGDPNKPRTPALMLGVASFVDVQYLELEDPKDEARKTITWLTDGQDWTKPHVIETGQVGKPVMVMTMDSFSAAILPFLYSHFSRIVLSHGQDGWWREDLINQFNPNVVMLEVLESGLGYSVGEGPQPSPEALARIDRAIAASPMAQPIAQAPGAAPAAAPVVLTTSPDMNAITPAVAAELGAAPPAENCNFELATLDGTTLTVAGWISELKKTNTAPEGWVRIQGPAGDYAQRIPVNRGRPDVQAFFKGPPASAESGFSAVYDVKGLKPGAYTATAYRRAAKGWIVCKSPVTLTAK